MILKIQSTKRVIRDGKETFSSGWVVIGDIKEVHQQPNKSVDYEGPGRKILSDNFPDKTYLHHIFVHYRDGTGENLLYNGSSYLMNEDGKTVESLYT